MGMVLIVGDHRDLAELLADGLESAEWIAAIADGGLEAVKIARSFRIDVVLCDMILTGTSGVELEEVFRTYPELLRIPFVFMADRSNYCDHVQSDRLLFKPFTFDQVSGALRRALDGVPG